MTRPALPEAAKAALETIVVPRSRDLGDFEVRRVLPSAERRMVGPFVFLDDFGPTVFRAGSGLDVRPHPHIGLATVTYLLEGEIVHRDSLGTVATIRPGEVNWMTAGRGIVHSERTDPARRKAESRLFGIQSWVALPANREEAEPGFAHHGADALPVVAGEGKRVRVIAGTLYGARSPLLVFSETLYADAALDAGAVLSVPATHEERALYIVQGAVELLGVPFESGRLLVLKPGVEIIVTAAAPARLLLIGGEPMDGPRHLWWNFVSRSKERIEQAKADWKAGRLGSVAGDPEFIPLPE
ncbi:MAG: pirin family protein [Proteobacteria bacterium]|nr:pirin family protein [Pseudomonadota bacterium]